MATNTKTREDLVQECTRAAEACYNHYSDQPLPQSVAIQLAEFLNQILPDSVSTEDWQQCADEYDARMAAETLGHSSSG